MPLLEVRNLRTHFATKAGTVRAVDDVSFELETGETLGLVGESGCGKSVTALSIMRLVDPPGRIIGGQVLLDGQDLLQLDEQAMLQVRGKRIAMIFQEPMTSMNPTFTVGSQILEALDREYYDVWRRGLIPGVGRMFAGWFRRNRLRELALRKRAVQLLADVHIPSPDLLLDDYPYMLSGGMLQRIMIAVALAGRPAVLIADEPTTAVDVTIQAHVQKRDSHRLIVPIGLIERT